MDVPEEIRELPDVTIRVRETGPGFFEASFKPTDPLHILEALDILHEAVVLNREIERETPRSRSLDAYRAVEDACREIRNDLGGAITVEQ